MPVVVFIFGAAIGSFLAAFTYRLPNGISIAKGRSFCPKCKKQIEWYDNIPLVSFVLLHGRCRKCGKEISKRYFMIELTVAILFTLAYVYFPLIKMNLPWLNSLSFIIGFAGMLVMIFILMGIFIVDMEHQFIPDEFVFFGIFLVFTLMIVGDSELLFPNMLAGLVAALFLLLIHLITKGKGMGLGDVKLALLIGFVLGIVISPIWMFLSFILGSIVGIYLLSLGKTKLKARIAFGPFLVGGFLISIFLGLRILSFLFPF